VACAIWGGTRCDRVQICLRLAGANAVANVLCLVAERTAGGSVVVGIERPFGADTGAFLCMVQSQVLVGIWG